LVELLIAYFLLGPECVYRTQQRVAFAVWLQKRTPEASSLSDLPQQDSIEFLNAGGAAGVQ